MDIRITTNSKNVINALTRFDEELEDELQEAIENTVNDIEQMAQETVTNFYELSPSSFKEFYNSEEQIDHLSASVTINSTFIPLVGNFPYEVSKGGSPSQTIRGSEVNVHYRIGSSISFASYNLIGHGTAYSRLYNSSYPVKPFFSPSIPVMLRDEIDYFSQLIEEAFEENVQEALGDL